MVSWRWMHEEETDRGRRRAAEFTPCLEKAPSCLVPFLLSSLSFPPFPFRSFFRIHSPISFHLVRVPSPRLADSSSILRHLFFLSTSPSSCLPASLTPRGHSGHCTRSYLPPSPSVQGEGLLDREPRRIALLQRGNAAIWRSNEDEISFFFRRIIVSR